MYALFISCHICMQNEKLKSIAGNKMITHVFNSGRANKISLEMLLWSRICLKLSVKITAMETPIYPWYLLGIIRFAYDFAMLLYVTIRYYVTKVRTLGGALRNTSFTDYYSNLQSLCMDKLWGEGLWFKFKQIY